MLSPQAWNAFLKTLEEPPPRTIFVLATTEAQKVLPTVVDRCHRFDFGRPSVEQVATVLRAGRRRRSRSTIDDGRGRADRPPRHRQLPRRARHARAARHLRRRPRDRARRRAGGARRGRRRAAVRGGRRDRSPAIPAGALRAAATLADSGRDPGQVLRDLEVHGRELLAVQVLGEVPPELRVTPERDSRLAEQATALSDTDAVRLLDLVSAALEATANGAQARIQLELVLVKAAAPELDPSMSALLARIERLEAGPRRRRRLRAAGAAPRPSCGTAPGPASDGARSRLQPALRQAARARPPAAGARARHRAGALDLDDGRRALAGGRRPRARRERDAGRAAPTPARSRSRSGS